MGKTKAELKKIACAAIDAKRAEITALGDSIFAEPELGYKEVKTAAKIKKLFDELGYSYRDQVALTGVIAPLKGKESKVKVAVMGELDAVVAPVHGCADKKTGAAHSCGHNAMSAALAGVAYALKDTGILEELSGDVVLMAVPAEEYVEIGYRNELRDAGTIKFLGGKQEFVYLGEMDDIDIMVMQHTATTEAMLKKQKKRSRRTYQWFCRQMIHYKGKEAIPAARHIWVKNALNAATSGGSWLCMHNVKPSKIKITFVCIQSLPKAET